MIGPLAAQTALVLLLGLCWGQQEFRDNYHPQWESTGEVWVGDCDTVQYNCPPDKLWDCWHPPFCPYHPIEVFLPKMNGKVIGRSMVFWPNRFVNLFLGIPYAKPPVDERRFKVSSVVIIAGTLGWNPPQIWVIPILTHWLLEWRCSYKHIHLIFVRVFPVNFLLTQVKGWMSLDIIGDM